MLKLIKTTVLDATSASVTISGIPQEFKLLKLFGSTRGDNSTDGYTNIKLSYNGAPSGTLYSDKILYGNNGSASSASNSSQPNLWFQYMNGPGSTSGTFSNFEINIPNYAGSNNKINLADAAAISNSSSVYILGISANLWTSTSPITSMTFTPNFGNFLAGSTFYLYGIA